ncbi:MAG: radical SAM protein [Elusimicrobiota bacterium]
MDITLINITTKTTFDGVLVNRLSTVGIFSIIACLEQVGIEVDFREYFLDFEIGAEKELETAVKFFEKSEKIIGIGCHSIHLPFAVKISQEIKKRYPEKFIILGGIGPSLVADKLMVEFDKIDMVVVGEAELNFPVIVKRLMENNRDFSDIGGIVFRKEGRIIQTPAMERIEDLDDIPMPAYKYLDVATYRQPMVMVARGCPFGCPFCSLGGYWKRKITYRSPERISEELKILETMGVKKVFFADSCFMLNKPRLKSYIEMIRKNSGMKEYKTYGRLDLIDEEACSMLADVNFNAIFYGLESGSDAVLKEIKGGFTVEQGLKVIEMSKKYFSRIEVSLMWGFPFETLEDLKQTIKVHDYLKNELGCVVQLTWFQPFVNTPYFEKYKDTLYRPEMLSAIYDRDKGRQQVSATFSHAGEYDYTISLRSVISHSHVYSMASDIINENPEIFPDFHRYKTLDLEEKVKLTNKIVPS